MIRKLVLQTSVSAAIIAALTACSGQQGEPQAHAGSHVEGSVEAAATVSHSGTDHAAAPEGRVSGHGTHDYKPPDIADMSGSFQLVDAKTGGSFTEKDLLGTWTLLYMGYIECLEACPIAMKTMPQAVDQLNALGMKTRAVFIDINAPRLDDLSGGVAHGANKPANADEASHGSDHGGHAAAGAGDVPVNELTKTGPEVRRLKIAEWGKSQDPDIILLSGSRKQVLTAGTLFKSRAEQTMMPTQEAIHHINHTTYIYGINPKGDVVALLYHADSPKMIVDEIVEASKTAP